MKRKIVILLSICMSMMCFSACDFMPREEEAIEASVMQPKVTNINRYEVKKGSITQDVKYDGKFVSTCYEDLSFKQRNGILGKVYVKLGDIIKKGDTIAELRTEDVDKDIKLQEFQLKRTEAVYNDLVKSNASEIEIKQADLDLQIDKLTYESMQKELNKYKLISSISGKIIKIVKSNPGEVAMINDVIATVADVNSIQIDTNIHDPKDVKVGMKVKVTYEKKELPGEIISVVSNISPDDKLHSTPYMLVKIQCLPQGATLGDAVNVMMDQISKDNVIIVPKEYIKESGKFYIVNIFKDNKRTEKYIQTGIKNDTMVEVVSGLNEGDIIVR